MGTRTQREPSPEVEQEVRDEKEGGRRALGTGRTLVTCVDRASRMVVVEPEMIACRGSDIQIYMAGTSDEHQPNRKSDRLSYPDPTSDDGGWKP
jgi:hypothetical protein